MKKKRIVLGYLRGPLRYGDMRENQWLGYLVWVTREGKIIRVLLNPLEEKWLPMCPRTKRNPMTVCGRNSLCTGCSQSLFSYRDDLVCGQRKALISEALIMTGMGKTGHLPGFSCVAEKSLPPRLRILKLI